MMPSKRPASPPSATMSSGLGMELSTARRVRPTALDRETPADIAHTPPTSTSVDLLDRPDRSHKTLTTTLRRYLSDVPHHLTPSFISYPHVCSLRWSLSTLLARLVLVALRRTSATSRQLSAPRRPARLLWRRRPRIRIRPSPSRSSSRCRSPAVAVVLSGRH